MHSTTSTRQAKMLNSLFPILLLFCVFLGTLIFKKITKSQNKDVTNNDRKIAPEPPGAWPFLGHLHLLGEGKLPLALTLGAMSDKYGPIFSLRLGTRRALVVSDWETIKECFTTNDRIFASRPSLAIGKYLGYNDAVFSLAPYGPYWRDMRKVVTLNLLTNNMLEKLKHVRVSEVDHCIEGLKSQCVNKKGGGYVPLKVNLSESVEHVTMNIAIRMLAGRRFSGEDSEDGRFVEAVKKELYLCGVFIASDAIPWLEWMDIGGFIKEMKKVALEADRVLDSWVVEHVEKMKNRKNNLWKNEGDFMDVLLDMLPEDEMIGGFKRDVVIKATVMNLILTASESTSTTIIWALSLLLNNPQSLKAVQQELDTHVGKNRQVEESDIKNLKFLQAIIKETLRLYPPGPLSGPREAIEDCYIGNYFVPKGTRLIANLWKMQRDPRVWSNPCCFQPGRFLEEHKETNFLGQNYEFIPFSVGRRMCPGMSFGLYVVQLVLARILHGFDISTPMGLNVDMNAGLGIALPKVMPLEVFITPRLLNFC